MKNAESICPKCEHATVILFSDAKKFIECSSCGHGYDGHIKYLKGYIYVPWTQRIKSAAISFAFALAVPGLTFGAIFLVDLIVPFDSWPDILYKSITSALAVAILIGFISFFGMGIRHLSASYKKQK